VLIAIPACLSVSASLLGSDRSEVSSHVRHVGVLLFLEKGGRGKKGNLSETKGFSK
jgi:hypothetical protein